MSAPHLLPIRVYYEDTDFSGFVYHASYLRFMERGRTECLRDLGIAQSALQRDENGLVFVVSRIEVDYLKPAAMDDSLTIATSIEVVRGASLLMGQQVLRGETLLARATVTVAAVRDGRVARLPKHIGAALGPSPS